MSREQAQRILAEDTKVELKELYGWGVEDLEGSDTEKDTFLVHRTKESFVMTCFSPKEKFSWESLSKYLEKHKEITICVRDDDSTSMYYKVTESLSSDIIENQEIQKQEIVENQENQKQEIAENQENKKQENVENQEQEL